MIAISALPENWSLSWTTSFDVSNSPLPRLFSGTTFTSPVIAIAVNINNSYWDQQAIGFCNQHVNTGLIGMGLARVTKNRLIFSKELALIEFPFKVNYQLSFDLFLKVASAGELIVYEYTGFIN